LAFSLTVFLGLLRGAGVESTLFSAITSLVTFAIVGAAIGAWAGWVINDSVQTQLANELTAMEISKP
jgi:hypothetical protein